jgi:hypothetical protein
MSAENLAIVFGPCFIWMAEDDSNCMAQWRMMAGGLLKDSLLLVVVVVVLLRW